MSDENRSEVQLSTHADDGKTICLLCPHTCHLATRETGICGARSADISGRIIDANYGQATALALDPIEKKPLERFFPGSMILSYGSFGCNLDCPFCQNSDIARARADDTATGSSVSTRYISPTALVQAAQDAQPHGNIGVAFTYNEPLIAWEYLRDCLPLLHAADLKTVVVTNGYITTKLWQTLLPDLDAANIDLKAFSESGYEQLGAPHGLETVKRNIATAAEQIHVEVTHLIVPGFNDQLEQIDALAAWLASISPEIPLHLTAFYPAYKMLDTRPTPRATVLSAVNTARQHLSYVYAGNI